MHGLLRQWMAETCEKATRQSVPDLLLTFRNNISKLFKDLSQEMDSYFEVKIIQDPSGVYGKDNMDDRHGEAILIAGSGQKYRLKCYYDDQHWGIDGGFVLSLFRRAKWKN